MNKNCYLFPRFIFNLTAIAVFLAASLHLPMAAAEAQRVAAGPSSPLSLRAEALIGEQKYQAALDLFEAESGKIADPLEQARVFVKMVQLETGLHDFETAIQHLMARHWPTDFRAQALLHLFHAHALMNYLRANSWEISQRTKVVSSAKKDLKTATAEELFNEAVQSLAAIWPGRAKLSDLPKAEFKDFIAPNDFPAGVRDHFRESFSFLFVRLLNDSIGWTSEQSNELSKLNLSNLMNGKADSSIDLRNPKIHPLQKIAALLSDLREWNEKNKRTDAELDALLELSKVLYQRFTREAHREKLRAKLSDLIRIYDSSPWSAMVAGTLAQFWMQVESPSALKTARSLAMTAAARFPLSLGAKLCRDLVKQIEAPQFELQAMRVDQPKQRSLELTYKNVRKVYFRSFRYDLKRFIQENKDYNHLPSWREMQEVVRGKPAYEWSHELQETSDYREHKAFLTPPAHAPGFYVVVASMQATFAESMNLLRGSMMFVSDLVLSHSIDNGKARFEVRHGSTGKFLPGVTLQFYQFDSKSGTHLESTLRTDASGAAEFVRAEPKDGYAQYGVWAEAQGQTAFVDFNLYSGHSNPPRGQQRVVFYSDRSIYRPQQKLLWKMILFQSENSVGQFHTVGKSAQTVNLVDMNGQVVDSKQVITDEFGSAWGEFVIPQGRTLGQWRLQNIYGQLLVSVEEYKRPTFELTWKESKSAITLNQKAELIGEAKYYFGAPVASGRVRATVERSVILPWWCMGGFFRWGSYQRPQIIETSQVETAPDGSFKIAFLPTADASLTQALAETKYQYLVRVEVLDAGGETRTIEKSLTVGYQSIEASLSSPNPLVLENKQHSVQLRRAFLSGGAAPGIGRWRLMRLREPEKVLMPADQTPPADIKKFSQGEFRLPDDDRQPRWASNPDWRSVVREWKEKEEVKSAEIKTDSEGSGVIALPPLKAGPYRIVYETKAPEGRTVSAQYDFFVANDKYRPMLSGLMLLTQAEAKVGDEIHIWIPSGLKDQTMVFEVHQDEKVLSRKILNTTVDSTLIRWPVNESMRGGLAFTLRLLNDYQNVDLSSSLFVPWDNKEISVSFEKFRNKLLPGQDEEWTVRLRGPGKENLAKASVQLLAYMYDRSLDQLRPHSSQRLLSIYPTRNAFGFPSVSLGTAPHAPLSSSYSWNSEFVWPSEDQLIALASYGIGGPGMRGVGRIAEKSMRSAGRLELAQDLDVAGQSFAAPAAATGNLKDSPPSAPVGTFNKSNFASEEPKTAKELRSNFSEAAFFLPQLLNRDDGSVDIKFKVPDSVTSWVLWLQGWTRDLKVATATNQAETVKDLIIRPYLPRFLREQDRARLRFMVNNTSTHALSGTLDIDLLDEETRKDAADRYGATQKELKAIPFSIGPNQNFVHEIKLEVPAGLGNLVIQSVARSGNFSDGEVRSLPILPGRFHLAQSKFITLRNNESRTIDFKELQNSTDASRVSEKLVVQIDAQLFYSVLSALPYLVNYPYECVEQTLNRFISTGILTSVFDRFPAIQKMAKEFSTRSSTLEKFDDANPNRWMALEETPWLNEARGGQEGPDRLAKILDSRVAEQTRKRALLQLEKAQTASGGFPWFSGGPPSPYITMYLVYGFSKAMEFGVEVPKGVTRRAWDYLHRHYVDDLVAHCLRRDTCWETVTFLNYIISNYPTADWGQELFSSDERTAMLNLSYRHWKEHSPYLKGYLALTLARMHRRQDAKLVWDSVMDSAKTSPDEGTYWAREDRTWLWYNDTIETHAFALRTLMELEPNHSQRDGLVQWLFLNKKMNHWQSTRATAEVIYSLANYLSKTHQLGTREAVRLQIGDQKPLEMEFLPEKYTGSKNQIVFKGRDVSAQRMPIVVSSTASGFMFASANWQFSTERPPEAAVGDFLSVDRQFFIRETKSKEVVLRPLTSNVMIRVGDEIEVHLSLRSKHPVGYVHLRDPRGAGFEPVDSTSKHKWDLGIYWYEEIRDSGTNFFFENLPQGEYTFKYRMRAATAGEYKVSPATIQPMYAPEFAAYSSGARLRIEKE